MNTLRTVRSLKKLFALFICICIGTFVSGCTSAPVKTTDLTEMSNPSDPKSIFVLFDGTANDQTSETNVWQVFNQLKQHKNKQTIARYIEGVGSVKEPLEDDWTIPIFGDALGTGMQNRILKGYDFIAQNYKPNDKIFIFGFSRGAHQARALAGLIAYAGVPATKVVGNDDKREDKWKNIIKLVKENRDKDYKNQWKAWKPNQAPLLASEIKDDEKLDMQTAEVEFLGVWDTVPGSSFKDYGDSVSCKESIGPFKTYLHWLPMVSKGERYKSDSYPPIRNIAHAVSLDEKRTMFKPLFLCSAINPTYTTLTQVVFPGAHADVGGGYEDGNIKLSSISLSWMFDLLRKHYSFFDEPQFDKGDAKGLAHLSISDDGGSTGSDCQDRELPSTKDADGLAAITPAPSIRLREDAGLVSLAVCEKTTNREDTKLKCKKDSNAEETFKIEKVEQNNIKCDYIKQQKWTE